MTLPELKSRIPTIPWFSRVGEPPGDPAALILRILPDSPTGDDGNSLRIALYQQEPSVEVSRTWDWLPTTHLDPDPIHGDALMRRAVELGLDGDRRTAELAVSQAVLGGLRPLPRPHPRLKTGRHDLTEAARGAATYATRMAARELVTDAPGFWCSVMSLYSAGHWPCGITHESELVVL